MKFYPHKPLFYGTCNPTKFCFWTLKLIFVVVYDFYPRREIEFG